jgi:hypothetical protein
MASIAYIASPIPRLITLEVVEGPRSALRQRSGITMMGIKAVVDVAVKAVRTVKPGASSKKHTAHKPIGPIVPIRSTVVWFIVEVAVRAHGSRSDIYADGHLGWRHRCAAQKADDENCKSKRTNFEHGCSLFLFDSYRVSTFDNCAQHNTQGSVPASLAIGSESGAPSLFACTIPPVAKATAFISPARQRLLRNSKVVGNGGTKKAMSFRTGPKDR